LSTSHETKRCHEHKKRGFGNLFHLVLHVNNRFSKILLCNGKLTSFSGFSFENASGSALEEFA
jgi:hypothetical protein